MIASSSASLLLLNGDLMVIAASASFYHEFQIEPAKRPNRQLSDLGNGDKQSVFPCNERSIHDNRE
ncbi:hypothetical protein DXT94_06180 [Rhizobium sp. ICMP 5592]|nr:hypothetical protein [Rhizobium sp. ICMP 5592]